MVTRGQRTGRRRPLYMISVAADLAGMHPQTLRIYERKQLIRPERSAGNTRLYSEADIERLRIIQHLTQVEGINLAGVERILELKREVELLQAELERVRGDAAEMRRRTVSGSPSGHKAEIVMVRRGTLARRVDR